MDFNVGDRVIHRSYGAGEILEVDQKKVAGKTADYYIVQTSNLTLWVPVEDEGESSLRFVTPANEFKAQCKILSSAGEALPEDRMERKTLLQERLRDGSLEAVCRVVRDLHELSKIKKLNDYDSAIMERAKTALLGEWMLALKIPHNQAEQELHDLLKR